MKRPLAIGTLLIAATVASARVPARAQSPDDRPLDPKVLAWDKGPDKIDVSKYPDEMKQRYKVYTEVCGRCHTIARAVNCDFVLEDEWERYIKKMMRRGRTLISPEQAEEVYEFALYDAKIRKKSLYAAKLAANR